MCLAAANSLRIFKKIIKKKKRRFLCPLFRHVFSLTVNHFYILHISLCKSLLSHFSSFAKCGPSHITFSPHTRIHLIVVFSNRKRGEKLKWFNFIYILCHIQIKYATSIQRSRKKHIYKKLSENFVSDP